MKNLALISFFCFARVVLTNAFPGRYDNYQRCTRRCRENFDVVCGTDNRNFVNECFLNNAKCNDQTRKLKKAHNGLCRGSVRGSTYNPVCGSDGKTYSNVAFLDLSMCLNKKYIKVVSKGDCTRKYQGGYKKGNSCDIGCPDVFNPVCGDDGFIYSSECVLEKQNCILGGNAVKKLHNGVCQILDPAAILEDESRGGAPFEPLCASDGNTYNNERFFGIARCQNKDLKKLYDGFCHQ